jgi:hypothetical protein
MGKRTCELLSGTLRRRRSEYDCPHYSSKAAVPQISDHGKHGKHGKRKKRKKKKIHRKE